MSQRRRHGADFKAKVSLEAVRGLKTVNEIAARYEVHPTQVVQWKKQVIEEIPNIFSSSREKRAKADEEWKAQLYQEIGQLQVELNWLKKKTGDER